MQDFLDFMTQPTDDWVFVIFICFFSLGIAFFYYLVFLFLNDGKGVKPGWLFFVLFPTIVILYRLILNYNVFALVIFFFILLISIFLLGMIIKGIKSFVIHIKKRLRKERGIVVFGNILKNLIIIAIVLVCFAMFGAVTIFALVLYGILSDLFIPNEKKRFLKLQSTLPTSKIASMAMGLVEVKGKTIMQEPLLSRIGKKKCIGYRYKIERISRDDDGKNHYTTISDEVFCNDFILKDKTAEVQVKASDIHFLWVEEEGSYSSGSKRYTQYLLFDGQEILLVGKANSKAGKVFIEKEPVKNVFTLAPYDSISNWNRYKPLLNRFLTYLAVLALLIAFILLIEINIKDNTIQFEFNLSLEKIINNNIFK